MAGGGDAAPRVTAKLDATNYLQWSYEMEHTLRYRGLWGLVVPLGTSEAEPTIAGQPLGGERDMSGTSDPLGQDTSEEPTGDAGSADDKAKIKTRAVAAAVRQVQALAGQEALSAAATARREQDLREGQARAFIMMHVKAHHAGRLRGARTARAVWEALADQFRSRGPAREINLRHRLSTIGMNDKEPVVAYFNRGWTLAWELEEVGAGISDRTLRAALLAGLPEKYSMTVEVLQANRTMTIDETLEDLQAAEERLVLVRQRKKSERRHGGSAALAATGERGADRDAEQELRWKKARCYRCNKRGHIKRVCPTKTANASSSDDKTESDSSGIAMIAVAMDGIRSGPPEEEADGGTPPLDGTDGSGSATTALAADGKGTGPPVGVTDWKVDSGASHHMCGDASLLTKLEACDPVTISVAVGQTVVATSHGVARLRVAGPRKPTTLKLKKVLLVPGMTMALFSVRTAAKQGYRTEFSDRGVHIRRRGNIILTGHTRGGIYSLTLLGTAAGTTATSSTGTAAAAADVSADIWHRRYCHLGVDMLKHTVDKVDGIDLSRSSLDALKERTCEPCNVGKMVRQPFVSAVGERTTRALQLVHSDAAGKMGVPTPKGNEYQVCVIDDYTRYKALVPVRTKGQAKDVVMQVVNLWENQTGFKVQALRTDDGKEYTGGDFTAWLHGKGIEHQRSAPYTSQHNGMAERFNRTVQERTSALLCDAGLDPKYWAEAATTINTVANMTPQRHQTATPYELFHGKRPDVSHLRVFGCRAWAYNPAKLRRKGDSRGVPAVFVGYPEGTKGYRVLIDGAVVVRRDVLFDEEARGAGAGIPTHQPEQYGAKDPLTEESAETEDGSGDDLGAATSIEDAIKAARLLTGQDGPDEDSEDDGEPAAESGEPPHLAGDAATAKGLLSWALAARARGNPDKMRLYQAKKEPDWSEFDKAIQAEVQSLWENGTWELTDLPDGQTVTPTEMLAERKRGADGGIDKYKGRFVVRGDKQTYLVDYTEVWAPVVRYTTLRVFLAYCAARGMAIEQTDVATAFLNGDVEEEIYIRQPVGYERGDVTKVCRLRKALYGLKQAARAWYHKLKETLEAAGFQACPEDPCLFRRGSGPTECLIIVYVDDMLVAGATKDAARDGLEAVTSRFKARELGRPTYFLGLHLVHNDEEGTLHVHQEQYVKTLLGRFGMTEAKPVRLPIGAGARLERAGEPLTGEDPNLYQELVGCLNYLATATRPDIAFAVGRLSRFVSAPMVAHLAAAKVVLRYLAGTKAKGLCYQREGDLMGYSDADFAADKDTRRSTSGNIFLFKGAAVSWVSKLQGSVATSTTEAEYVSAGMAAKELIWLQRLCGYVTGEAPEVLLLCDSQSALAMMGNAVSSVRTKHIDVVHHFVREKVASGELKVSYVNTTDMTADALTKPLGTSAFDKCAAEMGLTLGA